MGDYADEVEAAAWGSDEVAALVPGPVRCRHELILDQCGLCKPRPPASPPAGTDPFESATDEAGSGKGRWFRANFDSECSGCDGAIWEGEDIRADGFGGWEGRCCE